MVSITPCWKSVAERLRAIFCAGFLFALLFSVATPTLAGSIEPKKGVLSYADDGSTVLNAEFAIDLGPRLVDAVSRGVPLYFSLEFELTRPRWYWSNEYIVSKSIRFRLTYTALTRQYRLSTGNLHRNFATLDEALRVLSRFVDLQIADKGVLRVGDTYDAALRLALDKNQLPKPLQVDAIGDRDWQVDTRVLRWHYTPTAWTQPLTVPAALTMPVPPLPSTGDAKP